MPCRRCARAAADPASARQSSTPTKPTICRAAVVPCASGGSAIASPGAASTSSERLGRHRWVIERTLAWFSRFRRLTIRYERRADIFEAFHHLAAASSAGASSKRFC